MKYVFLLLFLILGICILVFICTTKNDVKTENNVKYNIPVDTRNIQTDKELRLSAIAFEYAKEAMEIPETSIVEIQYKGNIAVITFMIPHDETDGRPRPPGPDYYAQIEIDCTTETVLVLFVAS